MTKKPTTVASRGFLSKIASGATSPRGMAVVYDDHHGTNIAQQRIH
ncbi:MAG: hypothetical protein ABSG78_12070 [Verrucomicrobiota bacterium]|jgi:hypothetical protein